jgi:predicted Zn-dependent protease
MLRRAGRSPALFGQALERLVQAHEDKSERGRDAAAARAPRETGYLDSHPAAEERIRAAREAAALQSGSPPSDRKVP